MNCDAANIDKRTKDSSAIRQKGIQILIESIRFLGESQHTISVYSFFEYMVIDEPHTSIQQNYAELNESTAKIFKN